jgi:Fe-S-cluster containining protein
MGRAEQRRQLKFDKDAVARGLNLSARDPRQLASLTRVVHAQVQDAIAAKSVTPLMQFLYSHHTVTLRSVAHIEVACKRGCSYCCHGWVSATAPEILYSVKNLPTARIAHVTERVTQADRVTRGTSDAERARIVLPCPLLEDHACSVYETRPVICRSVVSTDALVCARSCLQRTDEDVPTPPVYFALSDAYTVALACALKKAGLEHRAFEQNAGLKAALVTPGAEQDWLTGKSVFPGVLKDHDLLNDPWVRTLYAKTFP